MNNDLISRSALKEEIVNSDYLSSDEKSLFLNRIDNAPTVTPSLNLNNVTEEDIEKFKVIFQRAHSKGLLTILEERPKGEWARHDEWRDGEYIGGFYHVNCPCEDGYYSKWRTNFCPNCGLPMQKGGADNE